MKIKKEIIDRISAVANSDEREIGGILGSAANGIITDMVADLPNDSAMCRFEYYPNIYFLNSQIEEWAKNNIAFLGLFHTHFSGSRNLSEADKDYIRTIMRSARYMVQYLCFPIFTLPENHLNVYKAYFVDDEIMIEEDELEII